MLFNIKLATKIAVLQLINNRKFSTSFIINLTIGLVGFVLVDAFKVSIDSQIQLKSKAVLGADISISARRLLSDAEIENAVKSLPEGSKYIEQIDLYSMAYNGDKSRLINIVAVDEGYPLIPALKLKDKGLIGQDDVRGLLDGGLWAAPELLQQLGSKIGDSIQVGEIKLQVKGSIDEDPSSSTSGFSLAPKIYMGRQSLEKAALLKRGSRLSHRALFLLPQSDTPIETFAESLHEATDAQDIQISTHKTASRELNRALILLGENLSLVALIALFLAGIGASYLFKSHTQSQIKDMSILLSIGYSHRQLLVQSFAKIFILSSIACLLITILSPIILPVVPYAMKNFSSGELHVSVNFTTIWFSFLVAMATSSLLCLPTLDLLNQVRPAILLKESREIELPVNFKRNFLLYIPSVVFFWILSCWQSRSLVIGSAFSAAFVVSAIVMFFLGTGLVKVIRLKVPNSAFPGKLSWLNLVQVPSSTIVSYLAISLCALLLNIIPHLEATVSDELKYPDNKEPPSLFLFDIQEDQLDGLEKLITSENLKLETVSPLIRARLEKTNGESVEREEQAYKGKSTTREREWANRLRNRTYNLSFRSDLIDSETLVKGSAFSGVYDWESNKKPEISLEYRFAERLELDIGDSMEFDIQGVSVEGTIVNTRKVKWTSFQPNFFVQFQPGVLNDAPKSYLAAVPKVSFDKKMETQNSIVEMFPNISIVDVEQTLQRITELMNNILGAVSMITFLAIFAGIAVIFSIMDHNAQLRLYDTNLYKMLGVSVEDLKKVTRNEVAFLISVSCLTGLLLSSVLTTFLTYLILDEMPVFNWSYSLKATGLMLVLGYVTGYSTVVRSLSKKPQLQL